jgi:DNA repair exonuclease SbcCD nuclease subunit
MLGQILSVARQENVCCIVVAGDVFDRVDVTNQERRLLSEWLAASEIPILMISGNHDLRSHEVGDTCISYLALLGAQLSDHLVYDGAPTVRHYHGVNFVLLPYHGWMDQEFHLLVEALLSRIPEDDATPIVVVAHEALYGCVNDAGMNVTKHHQVRLDSSFPRVTYWALGDMHARQAVLENAWYSGSPYQTNFAQPVDKGVLIVDTDDPGFPEFVQLEVPVLQILTSPPPDGWPSESTALIQYVPESSAEAFSVLPENVRLHPAIQESRTASVSTVSASLLDNLNDHLLRAGLERSLLPLAWRIVARFANRLDVKIDIPPEYEVHDDAARPEQPGQ